MAWMTAHAAALVLGAAAHAGSLDDGEVAGAWGTPGATNPSAVWWNPAGLAAERGTQILVEGASARDDLMVSRQAPAYAPARGGLHAYRSRRFVPFVGLSSDFGIDDLGIGIALFTPVNRVIETEAPQDGSLPLRHAARGANLRVLHAALAAARRFGERWSAGATVSLVDSIYRTTSDLTLYDDLSRSLAPSPDVEDPAYGATVERDLRAQTVAVGAGVRFTPTDALAVGLAVHSGGELRNRGQIEVDFSCPPSSDPDARQTAARLGTCNALVGGTGSATYDLPWRVHLAVVVRPVPPLRLEAFGKLATWSQHDSVQRDAVVDPEAFAGAASAADAEAASNLVGRPRPRARDNRDAWTVGTDGKWRITSGVGFGWRVTYDRAAVADTALDPLNFDRDSVSIGGLAWLSPLEWLDVGLSFSGALAAPRTATPRFGLGAGDRPERYRAPSTSGSYEAETRRIGLSVQARFAGNQE